MGSFYAYALEGSYWFLGLLPILMMYVGFDIWRSALRASRELRAKVPDNPLTGLWLTAMPYLALVLWIIVLVVFMRFTISILSVTSGMEMGNIDGVMDSFYGELVDIFVNGILSPFQSWFWAGLVHLRWSGWFYEYVQLLKSDEGNIVAQILMIQRWTIQWSVISLLISIYSGVIVAVIAWLLRVRYWIRRHAR